MYCYKTEGWEIKVFPLVIGVRGLVNVHHIHEVFAFLKIPRREWRHGLECFALASVKAFSFLPSIRYAARSAGTKDAVCHDESTSDHADGSDNGQPWTPATVQTRQYWQAPSAMATTRSHLFQAFTRSRSTPDCVLTLAIVRNGNIPAKAISQCERRLLSSPAAALEADSIHHTTRRRRTRKSSRRMKFPVRTTIRGKHSQLKPSNALSLQVGSCGSDPASLISCSTRRSTQMTLLSQSTPFNGTPLATTRRSGFNGRLT
jgi:hypothetical protein